MPKKKTHTGASKRFKKLKSGKVKYARPGHRHLLTKKTAKRKRHLKKSTYLKGRESIKIASLVECQ